jgi:hypothetical protein
MGYPFVPLPTFAAPNNMNISVGIFTTLNNSTKKVTIERAIMEIVPFYIVAIMALCGHGMTSAHSH